MMREYGNYKLFTSLAEIREHQCVPYPTSNDIRTHYSCVGYTKGYALAIRNCKNDSWEIFRCDTEEGCIKQIDIFKELVGKLPDFFGTWTTDFSDMYLFHTYSDTKPHWVLHSIVIEK